MKLFKKTMKMQHISVVILNCNGLRF